MLDGTVISHFPLGCVWYMGIGSENRHLIPFLPYSYVGGLEEEEVGVHILISI